MKRLINTFAAAMLLLTSTACVTQPTQVARNLTDPPVYVS